MRGVRDTDRNHRKYITITDTELWDKIDEIMTLSAYAKSFNKVINDALFYGLDSLRRALFGMTDEIPEEPQNDGKRSENDEEYNTQIIRLLQEIILNENINKAILCSLFEAKSMELKGERCRAERFDSGRYRETPECFVMDELKMLEELSGQGG